MKTKILIPIYNDWQSLFKLLENIDLQLDGCRIISNFGNHGRQEVPHLHFHLLGGKDIGKMLT